jgi:hypothetical protein
MIVLKFGKIDKEAFVHEKFLNSLLVDAFDSSKDTEACIDFLRRRRDFSLIISLFETTRTSAAAQAMIVPGIRMFFAMLFDPPTRDFCWLACLSVSLPVQPFLKAWWNSVISPDIHHTDDRADLLATTCSTCCSLGLVSNEMFRPIVTDFPLTRRTDAGSERHPRVPHSPSGRR